ncbi:MAG: peptidylprolyl isomerase [Pseudorhodoplanes sp.]
MSCSVRDGALPRRDNVAVNGVRIPRDLIAREIQNHPAASPVHAWTAAARSLVVRELLLQEARQRGIDAVAREDGEGRRETEEEALVRTLVEREVTTPEPDDAACRRYFEMNRKRFRSSDLFEAAHILISAFAGDAAGYGAARARANALLAELRAHPERFEALARAHSACPSAAEGGHLGQLTEGQTTAEFERALLALAPGEMSAEPVATRYGFHIIRLDRRVEGRELPYEIVAGRIANYLVESVRHRAIAQYIARLASRATITGVEMAGAEAHRVH